MNLQALGMAGLGAALVSQAPNLPEISNFEDLTAHIPELEAPLPEFRVEEEGRRLHGEYVPFATELAQPELSAADFNAHIAFRGVDTRLNQINVLDASEVNCLAENIYFEARGETLAAQMAVGLVTMNRLHSDEYPDTVCGVTRQGSMNGDPPLRDNCQFSWYCDGRPERIEDDASWNRALQVATRVLSGDVQDFTEGSTHFHANHVRPRWASRLQETISIDNITFYRKA